jgi:tRNA(fMet)-specific endonuclease VapC
MRYLLDTNTCVAALRNHANVVARMQAVSPQDCAVSTITSFELFTGVEKCRQPAAERKKIETLLRQVSLHAFDADAAREAAKVRAALEAHGQSIGPYDLLLAGQALSAKITLVTNNTREFSRIRGLGIEDWHIPAQAAQTDKP